MNSDSVVRMSAGSFSNRQEKTDEQSVHVLRVGIGVRHAQISAVGMSLLTATWREERIIEEGFLREYRSEA